MTGEISTGPSPEPGAPVLSPSVPGLSWSALRRADPEALRAAEGEALEIARALAVESLALDGDAELDELEERCRHLARTAWPTPPLEGYRLQSSLGAFVVARVAVTWVPSGQVGLRRHPLERPAVLRALGQQGVDAVTAESILGDWSGPIAGFRGTEDGLDPGTLAGLAERSLTKEERDLALGQVAASGRDLARLATCVRLGRAVRRLLPVLADEALGTGFVATLALTATGRPERALSLLPRDADSLRWRTVRELAQVAVGMNRREAVVLAPDPWAPGLPQPGDRVGAEIASADISSDTNPLVVAHGLDRGTTAEIGLSSELGEGPPELPEDLALAPVDAHEAELEHGYDLAAALSNGAGIEAREGGTSDLEEEVDDVLEIVEESVDPDAVAGRGWRIASPPEIPAWWPEGPNLEAEWAAWRALSTCRRSGRALGIGEGAEDPRGAPIPPDPRLVGDGSGAESLADPFLPAVRSLVRGVLGAVSGEFPDLREPGGLEWALRRITALAHAREGDLERAEAALGELWADEAPEQRWIIDRKVRYEGRQSSPATAEEVRIRSAPLVLDLARALARTLSGAFPDPVEPG